MKYLQSFKDVHRDLRTIAGEMINTMTGYEYFTEGVYQPNASKYNTYMINTVEYEINPNVGVVICTGNSLNDYIIHVESMVSNMLEELKKTISCNSIIGTQGTSQYISITAVSKLTFDVLVNEMHMFRCFGDFRWFIFTGDYIRKSPLYIPKITETNNAAISLSTVLFDDGKLINLPHGYKSCDFPSIDKYASAKYICEESIYMDHYATIDLEICKNYTKTQMKKYKSITASVYWKQWDGTQYRKLTQKQYLAGKFSFDKLPYYTSQLEFTCAMSGLPIYDDCYIFDIYTVNQNQTITQFDTPVQLLISPVAMHYLYGDTANNIFTSRTNTQIIIYRTRCPINRISYIQSLKKSINYKKTLLAFDQDISFNSVTSNNYYFVSRMSGIIYKSVSVLSISDILQVDENQIISLVST